MIRQYKTKSPIDTIQYTRGLLAATGHLPYETTWASPHKGIHSVRLEFDIQAGGFGTNGKGRTREYCLASAYGEMMERLQNGFTCRKLMRSLVLDLQRRVGFYYAPDEKLLTIDEFSNLPEKVRQDLFGHTYDEYVGERRSKGLDTCVFVPFYDTLHKRTVDLPHNVLITHVGSNGMCAGNTMAEALHQGIHEIMERWAAAEVFYGRLTPPTVNLDHYPQSQELKSLRGIIAEIESKSGLNVTIKDFSAGIGIPALGSLIVDAKREKYRLDVGCDSSFDVALSRSLTEIYQGIKDDTRMLSIMRPIPRDNAKLTDIEFDRFLRDSTGYFPAELFGDSSSYKPDPAAFSVKATYEDEVRSRVEWFHNKGYTVFIRDVSFLGFPSAVVYVPEISHVGKKLLKPQTISVCDDMIEELCNIRECDSDTLQKLLSFMTDELPPDAIICELLDIELDDDNPYAGVPASFVRALIAYKLERHDMALAALKDFLALNIASDTEYYALVQAWLECLVQGGSDRTTACSMMAQHGYAEDAVQSLRAELDMDVFQYLKLPQCPRCDECSLIEDCITRRKMNFLTALMPLFRRVDQQNLASLFTI